MFRANGRGLFNTIDFHSFGENVRREIARENGSMTRVAEKTGLERTHLYRKLKQLGVDLSRGKRGAGG